MPDLDDVFLALTGRPGGAPHRREGGRAMSAMTYAARDSQTMLRRSMKRLVRYPSQSLFVIGIPIVFLLLFVYVFGGTLGDGLGAPSGGRQEYVNYVVPGIILMTAAAAARASRSRSRWT